MHTLKAMAAVAVAVTLALTGSVGATTRAPRPGPGPANPNEQVLVQKGPLTLNPYSVKCFPSDEMYKGQHEIWIKNTGTETIQPTFYLTITWPDGSTYVYTVNIPLKPGDALGANVPTEHFKEPFKCGAKLSFTKP